MCRAGSSHGRQETPVQDPNQTPTPPATPAMHVLVLRGSEIITDPPEPLESLRGRDGQVVWVDVPDPSPATMADLAKTFSLHPLAVEDALKRRQRPKAEEYEHSLFITTHAARARGAHGHGVALDEIDLFFGRGFVITVHGGGVPALDDAPPRPRPAAPPPPRAHARSTPPCPPP